MALNSPRVARVCDRVATENEELQPRCNSRIQELLEEESTFRSCNDQVAFEKSTQSYQLSLWRDRVAQWCYDVVDHLHAPRDTVYLAMNFLDRSVATSSIDRLVMKDEYELTSITCLFLAIRVSTKDELRISDLLQISHSRLLVKDIQDTGSRLLHKLSLKTPMISPSTFAKYYLRLIGSSVSTEFALSLLEMACYLVELSVCDHFFTFVPPSKLAYAAVSICATSEQAGLPLEAKTRTTFMHKLQANTGLSLESSEIKPIFDRLLAIYRQSNDYGVSNTPNLILDDSEHLGARPALDSNESLFGMLPWTPSACNLSGLTKRPEKKARLV